MLFAEIVDQCRQASNHMLNQLEQLRRGVNGLVDDAVEQVFNRPGQLANDQRLNHTATALEGVERSAYGAERFSIGGFVTVDRPPFIQRLSNLGRFFQEDVDDVVVDQVVVDRRFEVSHGYRTCRYLLTRCRLTACARLFFCSVVCDCFSNRFFSDSFFRSSFVDSNLCCRGFGNVVCFADRLDGFCSLLFVRNSVRLFASWTVNNDVRSSQAVDGKAVVCCLIGLLLCNLFCRLFGVGGFAHGISFSFGFNLNVGLAFRLCFNHLCINRLGFNSFHDLRGDSCRLSSSW